MHLLRSCFSSLFITPILIVTVLNVEAQTLNNVTDAFNAISLYPQILHFKIEGIKIPAGGHLQGIQSLSDSIFVITASSESFSYYVLAQVNQKARQGSINTLRKIADTPFRHAGGCQVSGKSLAVGIEDNIAKDKSDILIIAFNDSLEETSKNIVAHRRGVVKRSTAGAVGFAKTKTGEYLLVVGDWDSRNIDFYLSRSDRETVFDSLTTFHVPDNQKWPSYQSINLLSDTAGSIYLIGFALDGLNNRADLFKVNMENSSAALQLISTRNFKCKGGAGFRYGAGIGISEKGSLTIYSCGRNAYPKLAVNILRSR